MTQRPLYFVGDPHGDLSPVLSLAHRPPGAVVLVGDIELPGPARTVLAPLLERHAVLFVAGNHDAASCQQWSWLMFEKHGIPAGFLGNRVAAVGGVRVAGLSGVYRGRVWRPGEEARHATRQDWMRSHRERWKGGMPLEHVDTIFPEDHAILARQRCDVLVAHEGPSSVHLDLGWSAIDDLAADMGAAWVVHGHHHHSSENTLPNGIRVKSLAINEIWEMPQ